MIKILNEFKLTVVHFARLNPMQICAHTHGFTAGQNKLWKIRTEQPGLRAAGPSGRRAAGPWQAVGRGPLGRGPAFSKTQVLCIHSVNLDTIIAEIRRKYNLKVHFIPCLIISCLRPGHFFH